jgi:hypothetical protein
MCEWKVQHAFLSASSASIAGKENVMSQPKPASLDSLQNIERAEPRQLWDRLPGETLRAFTAFTLYRDMTDRRTLKLVAERLNPACSVQNVFRWATRWNWSERTLAYDAYIDARERDELIRGRIEMRRRHLRMAMAMQGVGTYALAQLQKRIEQGLPLNMNADEAKSLMAAGVKLERDTLGPHREHQYTSIHVIVGEYKDEEEAEGPTSEEETKKVN